MLVVHDGAKLAAKIRRVAHGTVPVTNDGLGDQAGEVVIVLPAQTLDGKGNVGRGKSVITESDFGADELGSPLLLKRESLGGRGRGLAGEATEVLLGQSDELLVGDTTSTNQDHAVRGVVGLDVVGQVVTGDGLDVLPGTKDGTTEGLSLERGGVEVVENNLLQLLVNLLLLAQDDVPLALNRARLQLGVLKNICKDVDGLGNIVVERLGVVDGVFPLESAQLVPITFPNNLACLPSRFSGRKTNRCVGIEVRAHVLNFQFQLVLGPLVRALESRSVGCPLFSPPYKTTVHYL